MALVKVLYTRSICRVHTIRELLCTKRPLLPWPRLTQARAGMVGDGPHGTPGQEVFSLETARGIRRETCKESARTGL